MKKNIIKKKLLKAKHYYNTDLVNMFIKQYPDLASGRKNYLKKEIEIAKDICLTKIYNKSKKYKPKIIKVKKFKKNKKSITLTAEILY